jgi:peptidoglycan hydrolase CwlO-like protein
LRHARVAAATLVAVVAAGATVAGAPLAAADTSGQADANVHEVLQRVRTLQQQVTKAENAYAQALDGVAGSVNGAILDGQAADAAAATADAARAQLDDRARGLYMSGGPLAIYAALLDAHDPGALQDQAVVVSRLVSADRVAVAAVTRAQAVADTTASQAQSRAHARIQTERSVAVVAARLESLLAQQQALLDQAKAHLAAVRAAEQALAAQRAALSSITTDALARLHAMPASASYMDLYRKAVAAECPALSWTVLAAVGQVESGHGRDVSTSYAGAMGPMQFLPATFERYAVDGDGDGNADIMSAPDAIYTAARYLCANGAGGSSPDAVARAIWHYNHADWYVQMVLTLAQQYAA